VNGSTAPARMPGRETPTRKRDRSNFRSFRPGSCRAAAAVGRGDVERGGPWVGGADIARVSVRMGWITDDRCNNIGFRLARSKSEGPSRPDQK